MGGAVDRIRIVTIGWVLIAAGAVSGVILAWYARASPGERVPGISGSHVFVGIGIVLVVVGIAFTLCVEPVDCWHVRLYYYFGGVALIAAGSGAIYLTQFSPYDEALAILGATLIIAGYGLATYGGSFKQWRRRIGYTILGVAAVSAGTFAAFAVVVVVALGAAQSMSTSGEGGKIVILVVAMITVPAVAAAGWAFTKAWRAPRG